MPLIAVIVKLSVSVGGTIFAEQNCDSVRKSASGINPMPKAEMWVIQDLLVPPDVGKSTSEVLAGDPAKFKIRPDQKEKKMTNTPQ